MFQTLLLFQLFNVGWRISYFLLLASSYIYLQTSYATYYIELYTNIYTNISTVFPLGYSAI